MTGAWKRTFFAAAAILALACQTQEPASEQGSEIEPAADAAAVREAITANDAAFADALVAGDIETVVAMYLPDAIILPPGSPIVEGSDGIRETFSGMVAASPLTSMTLAPDEVIVASAGDYAYARGAYTLSGAGPDGAEWSDTGKYIVVWKNEGGEWKMARDIWNSDGAPGAAAGTADSPAESGEPAEPAE